MTHAEAEGVLKSLHSITVEDLLDLNCSEYSLRSRMLRSWRPRKPLRKALLTAQGGRCAITGVELADNGVDVHVDHVWTIKEAVAAWKQGSLLGATYRKLWAQNNLRAITPAENYKRNRKEVIA